MIDLYGNFLKVLIEENDKFSGRIIHGFNVCKDNIMRSFGLMDPRQLYKFLCYKNIYKNYFKC